MERFAFINQLAGQFHVLNVFLQRYGTYLSAAGLVFSLLNCFFGYRLRKLWNVIAGFLAGTAAGFVLCNYFGIASAPLTLLAALGCGLVCAVLAYLLYRLGLFLLCACLTIFVLFRLLNPSTAAVYGICLILGAVVGIFALLKERLTVSLATAIGGGWASAEFLLALTGSNSSFFPVILTLIFAFLGILVQLKPWKSRDYWDDKDSRLRQEEKRAKKAYRSQKRKQQKKKSRVKKEKKRARKEKRRTNSSASSSRTSSGSSKKSSGSAQTAGTAQSPQADAVSNPTPAAEEQPSAFQASSGAPARREAPQDSALDLSDIRLQLSREVQEIYQETQSADTNTPKDQNP